MNGTEVPFWRTRRGAFTTASSKTAGPSGSPGQRWRADLPVGLGRGMSGPATKPLSISYGQSCLGSAMTVSDPLDLGPG
jgi:hypothetical protein